MIPNPLGRRAWVRYVSSQDAVCRTPGSRDFGWLAKVRDISAGGIGLLMRHRFRPGSTLLIDVRNSLGNSSRVLPVRVVHATAVENEMEACWLVGCAFDRPLSDEELQAIL